MKKEKQKLAQIFSGTQICFYKIHSDCENTLSCVVYTLRSISGRQKTVICHMGL
jgi:hypothetical protein